MTNSLSATLSALAAASGLAATTLLLPALTPSARAEAPKVERISYTQQEAKRPGIEGTLAPFSWGMTPENVYQILARQVAAAHLPAIEAEKNPIARDELFSVRDRDIRRLKHSYVTFAPEADGWDGSVISPEFNRGTGESMLVYRQNGAEQYYFFVDRRLYKVVRRIRSEDASAAKLQTLAGALKGSLGTFRKAREETRHLPQDYTFLDSRSQARLYKHGEVYSSFGLAFEDRNALRTIEERRASVSKPEISNLHLNLALSKTNYAARDANVVDRIVGHRPLVVK